MLDILTYYNDQGGFKPNPLDAFAFGTSQMQSYNNFNASVSKTDAVGPSPSDNPTASIPGGTRGAAGGLVQ